MQKRRDTSKRGFTLIELLVVIAIIAVLAVVVILTLNPAGLLQESRDSNRISDMATLRSALSIYLADVSSPTIGTSTYCYISETVSTTIQVPTSATQSTSIEVASTTCSSWFVTAATSSFSANQSTTGGGWIPVNFSLISAGSPFSVEPIDPTNNTSFYYDYISSAGRFFKLGVQMESKKYASGGTADVESGDGGSNVNVYEIGNNLSL